MYSDEQIKSMSVDQSVSRSSISLTQGLSVSDIQDKLNKAKYKLDQIKTSLQNFRNKNFEVCWSTDY